MRQVERSFTRFCEDALAALGRRCQVVAVGHPADGLTGDVVQFRVDQDVLHAMLALADGRELSLPVRVLRPVAANRAGAVH